MFKPRVPEPNKSDEHEIKRTISALKAKLSSIKSSENFENTFSFYDVVEVFKKENASLSELLDYEETIRKDKLEKEKSILSRDKDEEESLIASCSDYVKNESFLKGEAVDNAQEMLLKLEVLHKKLCTLLKKFAHDNFPVAAGSIKSSRNKTISGSCKTKKSLLNILKLLLPELSSADKDNSEPQVVKIDKSVPKEIIEFLLLADIIEKFPDDPNYIKLLD